MIKKSHTHTNETEIDVTEPVNMNSYKFKKYMGVVVILVLIVVLAAAVFVVRRNTFNNSNAAGTPVALSLSPSSGQIVANTKIDLLFSPSGNQIGFAKVDLVFDKSKINLASDVSVSNGFRNVIFVTSRTEANQTGRISMAFGVAPGATPPSNQLVLASMTFSPVTSTSNSTATISIDSINEQLINLSRSSMASSNTNGSYILNVTSATATPTTKPSGTITPTTKPSATATPRAATATPVASGPTPTFPPTQQVIGVWSSPSELASKPMSGDAWIAVKSAADSLSSSASPDLDNQDDSINVKVLAAAIVYARNGDSSYKSKVVSALQKVENFNPNGRSLAWARETGAYAMAADLIGYRSPAFIQKMRDMAEKYLCSQTNLTLLDMFKDRPNNWGSQAFGSLTAIYSYLGDRNKLTEVRDYYLKNLNGPKPQQTTYGDLSWQCNSSDPRIINPKGCTKVCGGSTVNVDGIIPDDMRRGAGCKADPTTTGYPWEGMQGYTMGARVLERAGLSIWGNGDRALCRAASALQDGRFGVDWKATGDDQWQLPILDKGCGTNWSSSYGTGKWGAGKNTGWAYVL